MQMSLRAFVPVLLAGAAAAQSLTDVLAANNATLSTLISLLQAQPSLLNAVAGVTGITILAPSNDAFAAFLNDSANAAAVAADPDIVPAILSYHVLNGTFYASDITSTPAFVPSLLMSGPYANVTGGQRVEAVTDGSDVTFVSGLKMVSKVTTANVNFTGGVIHVIDKVLTLPANVTTTATAANLTSLAGAVTQAGLVDTLTNLRDVTIFAPTNAAFDSIGNILANITVEQLTSVLTYHVISGSVVYSTGIQNGATAATVNGESVTFTIQNGDIYVNSAKVVLADVLIANGVVHVIDGVLNPANTTVRPDNSSSTNPAPFPGANSTSGSPAPTGTGTGPSPSTAAAAQLQTGAMGVAALFGAAVMAAIW